MDLEMLRKIAQIVIQESLLNGEGVHLAIGIYVTAVDYDGPRRYVDIQVNDQADDYRMGESLQEPHRTSQAHQLEQIRMECRNLSVPRLHLEIIFPTVLVKKWGRLKILWQIPIQLKLQEWKHLLGLDLVVEFQQRLKRGLKCNWKRKRSDVNHQSW